MSYRRFDSEHEHDDLATRVPDCHVGHHLCGYLRWRGEFRSGHLQERHGVEGRLFE